MSDREGDSGRSDAAEDERILRFQEAVAPILAKRDRQREAVSREIEQTSARDRQAESKAAREKRERNEAQKETVEVAKGVGKAVLLIGCWSVVMIPLGFVLLIVAFATGSPVPVIVWIALYLLSILLIRKSKNTSNAQTTRSERLS